jgi:hypothetical protein
VVVMEESVFGRLGRGEAGRDGGAWVVGDLGGEEAIISDGLRCALGSWWVRWSMFEVRDRRDAAKGELDAFLAL